MFEVDISASSHTINKRVREYPCFSHEAMLVTSILRASELPLAFEASLRDAERAHNSLLTFPAHLCGMILQVLSIFGDVATTQQQDAISMPQGHS